MGMAVVMCLFSWAHIPFGQIPFTLQTFAVFLSVLVLGGRAGTMSVAIYIVLGIIGLPVFSSFQGGTSYLAGPTGGYIFGFFFIAILYRIFEKFCEKSLLIKIAVLLAGLAACYTVGAIWFVFASSGGQSIGFGQALKTCVLPYIIPDIAKLALALFLSSKLRPLVEKYTQTEKPKI